MGWWQQQQKQRNSREFAVMPSRLAYGHFVSTACPSHPVLYCSAWVCVFNSLNKQPVKIVTPIHDGARVAKVSVSPTGQLAVLFTNSHLLVDPDITVLDVPLPKVATFGDQGIQAMQAVGHLHEPMDASKFIPDATVNPQEGTAGSLRFGERRCGCQSVQHSQKVQCD